MKEVFAVVLLTALVGAVVAVWHILRKISGKTRY